RVEAIEALPAGHRDLVEQRREIDRILRAEAELDPGAAGAREDGRVEATAERRQHAGEVAAERLPADDAQLAREADAAVVVVDLRLRNERAVDDELLEEPQEVDLLEEHLAEVVAHGDGVEEHVRRVPVERAPADAVGRVR